METTIIFIDLDFTLLRSDRTISQHTISVLQKCQQKGILIGFSTSRGFPGTEEFANLVHPDIQICNAGACVYFKNQLIHSENFQQEEAQKLFNKVYEVCGKDVEITADTIDSIYWNRKENKTQQYMQDSKFDDFKNFSEPVLKFCVQLTDGEKAKKIACESENCSSLAFSDIPWYKFAPKSATKENAIKFISNYLNIPLENTFSFGDDFSDIGMLKTTGKGIAMKNAIPEVKKIADDETLSCDEDGVAVYIEDKILLEK